MNIWINKIIDENPTNDFENAYIFDINHEKKAAMYSNFKDIWLDLGVKPINSIYEDLYIIAISVFAVDKRISRKDTKDRWTREIHISIPVLNKNVWDGVKHDWNRTLKYLTGDSWEVDFRETEMVYGEMDKESKNLRDLKGCTAVSLFSGGLDSFCGAIELMNQGESLCFVGHNEYPSLEHVQDELKQILQKQYNDLKVEFISFTANSRAPHNNDGFAKNTENTSRSRSLLFIGAAVCIAGILGENVPVYIPENGFIGLNIPLTNSRKGTCSTRTTHPYFIRSLNNILITVGINNQIKNFFAYKSKREIVEQVKDSKAFIEGAGLTISCSHPCLPRWKKEHYPQNCGYCYPCLIRKSSLQNLNLKNDHYTEPNSLSLDFIEKNPPGRNKINDVKALMSALYRYKQIDDKELKRLIACTGRLESKEIDLFLHVYKSTMDDIIEMIEPDKEIKEFIGIE